MIKLVGVTAVALFGGLHYFGDDARRPVEVSRAEPLTMSVAAPSFFDFSITSERLHVSEISDAQAVEMAMAEAQRIREERASAPKERLLPANVVSASVEVPAVTGPMWYVTGSRVNLRGGPGTANPVVGQVTLGAQAEVLGDTNGWYQIRLSDGSASGWIFGKFLSESQPG